MSFIDDQNEKDGASIPENIEDVDDNEKVKDENNNSQATSVLTDNIFINDSEENSSVPERTPEPAKKRRKIVPDDD